MQNLHTCSLHLSSPRRDYIPRMVKDSVHHHLLLRQVNIPQAMAAPTRVTRLPRIDSGTPPPLTLSKPGSQAVPQAF